MKLEKIVNGFIWGGIPLAEKLPYNWMRVVGIIAAYFMMILTSPVWIPLAIVVGLKDALDKQK